MSAKTYSFYRSDTGEFTGQTFTGPPRFLDLNTPPGCVAVEGAVNPRRFRMQIVDGESAGLVETLPMAPEDTDLLTHEFDRSTWSWVARPTARGLALLEQKAKKAQARLDLGATIRYNEDEFDADEKSVAALTRIITTSSANRAFPPSFPGWRSATNRFHAVDLPYEQTMKFLVGLLSVIEERNQEILAGLWKEEQEQLGEPS